MPRLKKMYKNVEKISLRSLLLDGIFRFFNLNSLLLANVIAFIDPSRQSFHSVFTRTFFSESRAKVAGETVELL